MVPEKSLLFLATDISSLNNSCFLHSFHRCHILSRDFLSLTDGWKRLQSMLQKSLTGRQEIWNGLSGQESYKEMSRSKDKTKLLKCDLKCNAESVNSLATIFPAVFESIAIWRIEGRRLEDWAI